MANTYSNLYVHIVFTVRNREAMITEEYRERLQRFITGIVTNRKSKVLSIYCMPDHTHLFIGLNPSGSISDLVRDVKTGSTQFIKWSAPPEPDATAWQLLLKTVGLLRSWDITPWLSVLQTVELLWSSTVCNNVISNSSSPGSSGARPSVKK